MKLNTKWNMVPLGEICFVIAGGTPPRKNKDFYNGEIPWVKISDMLENPILSTEETITKHGLENSNAKLIPAGTVLISIFATIGRTSILGVDATTNQAIVGMIPKDKKQINSKFLKSYLDYSVRELIRQSRGVAQNNINSTILKQLNIPLPLYKEQTRIVEILDKTDAMRQKRKESIKLLDDFLRSTFLEMFGDPIYNPKKYPIEEIGKHIDILTGYPFKSDKYVADTNQINICGGLIIMPDKIDWEKAKYWSQSNTKGLDQYFLNAGDIVVAMDRPWISSGFKIGLIKKKNLPALLIQRTARIRAKSLNQHFLYNSLKNKGFKIHCKPTETTVPHITANDFKSYRIPIPPIHLQNKFADIVKQTEKLKDKYKESEKELDNLFGSLMQRAFKGEL